MANNEVGPPVGIPELGDWLPMPPDMGPPLPRFLNIFWPWYEGAEFHVGNLVIYPQVVNPGQLVTITATVENIGNEAGSYTVKLGGDFMAEKTISLQPGESQTVSFEATPTEAKVYSVSVDGLSGSFTATEEPVADIRLENLVISPTEVFVGETVTISVTATNYGNAAGSRTISCIVT